MVRNPDALPWTAFRRSALARSGRSVVLRTPEWEDLEALTGWIYCLARLAEVEANLWPLSREEASQWAGAQLSRWFRGDSLLCLAEMQGSVVGEAEITRQPAYQSHVGVLSLGVLPLYRNDGVGRVLLEEVLRRAPQGGLEMVQLSVFSLNRRAELLYRSVGFEEAGRIRGAVREGDTSWDEVVMVRRL